MWLFMLQPTILRLKRSCTAARYSQPSPVLICLMSAHHTRSGASGGKSRPTRSPNGSARSATRHTAPDPTAPGAPTPSSPTPRRRPSRTAGRQTVPWPSWLPRCAGRQSPGPGLPREEGRCVLENVTLLLQALDALPELSELLALGAGDPVLALA